MFSNRLPLSVKHVRYRASSHRRNLVNITCFFFHFKNIINHNRSHVSYCAFHVGTIFFCYFCLIYFNNIYIYIIRWALKQNEISRKIKRSCRRNTISELPACEHLRRTHVNIHSWNA